MSETAPTQVGPYTLQKLLATGAQAQVWIATGPQGEVALKLARTDAHKAALKREAFVLEKVGEHPRIVKLLAAADDFGWLALERVKGTQIDQWAQLEEPEEIVQAAIEVLDAIEALHAKGVIHGDIKPSNVLVDMEGHIRLIDLGIATVEGDKVKGFKGTLGYAAPELLKGASPKPATDLYGLGAMLYACITGRPPFVAADPAALSYLPLVSLPPPPSAFKPEIPNLLNQLLLALLARNPKRRPHQLSKVRDTLESAAASKPGPPVLGMMEEREELRQAVVGAADGEPRVVILYGPPGSGRRTLIAETVEYARREGLVYMKGTDPKEALAQLRKADQPSVVVMRSTSSTARKLAQIVLKEGLPCLFLLHAERPVPALAQRGGIQITPAPLAEIDTTRLARMYGADTDLADQWWRDSLGLPIAVLGHIRAWKRSQLGGALDIKELPGESRKIYIALQAAKKMKVADLARFLDMGEHTLLDHCEVLFAEGVVAAADDGAALSFEKPR